MRVISMACRSVSRRISGPSETRDTSNFTELVPTSRTAHFTGTILPQSWGVAQHKKWRHFTPFQWDAHTRSMRNQSARPASASLRLCISFEIEEALLALFQETGQLFLKVVVSTWLKLSAPAPATPAGVVEATIAALRAGHTHYSWIEGSPELRRAIARGEAWTDELIDQIQPGRP